MSGQNLSEICPAWKELMGHFITPAQLEAMQEREQRYELPEPELVLNRVIERPATGPGNALVFSQVLGPNEVALLRTCAAFHYTSGLRINVRIVAKNRDVSGYWACDLADQTPATSQINNGEMLPGGPIWMPPGYCVEGNFYSAVANQPLTLDVSYWLFKFQSPLIPWGKLVRMYGA